MSSLKVLNEYAKETMRGGRSELSDTGKVKNKTVGGLDKSYAFEYSYGKAESFTMIVPAIYGGGEGNKQLGPESKYAEKLEETFRMPEDNAVQYANGATYWGDQPIQSGTVYFGAIICFLFILSMTMLKGWVKWWLLGASIIGVVLAWGSNFQAINYFLFDHLPYYNKFRAPAMALFIPQLCFPIAAALGMQQLFFGDSTKEELWKKLKLSGIVTGAVLLLLVLMYFNFDYSSANDARLKDSFTGAIMQQMQGQQPTPQVQQQADEAVKGLMNGVRQDRQSLYGKDLVRTILLIGFTFGLCWAWVSGKLKKKEYALAGILLLGAFDLLQVGRRYLSDDNFMDADQNEAIYTATAIDQDINKDTGYYRVLDMTVNPFVDARTSYFHDSIGGYSPAKLGLYQDIIDRQISKNNRQVLNMLNTKYFIVQNPSNGQPMKEENPGALGPAWFVKALVYARNADDEMHILDNLNTKDSAVVDDRFKSVAATQPVYDSTASITMQKNMNDTIVYTTQAATPQFAVFSEIYYPFGWDAYIDGKKTDYARVDYILRGMAVPAGKHTIEFKFEPASYYTGNTISLCVNILLCVLLLAAIGVTFLKKKE